MRIPLRIDTTSLLCCQKEPKLNEDYAVPVRAFASDALSLLPVQLQALATPLPAWDSGSRDTWPTRLDFDGASVHYESHLRLHGAVTLLVTLWEGSHGAVHPDLPPVHGRVARLRIVEEEFGWDEPLGAYTNDSDDPSRHRVAEVVSRQYRHLWWPQDYDVASKEPFWEATCVVADLELVARA